jgi:tripartite-type tricarboxylate transporter receptor subunit TctC
MKVAPHHSFRVLIPAMAGLLVVGSCGPAASPRPVQSSSRPVRIIVGATAGGGQDLYARLLAPALSRSLPGEPTVIVESMPGAGGLVAASYLARRAAPDGLTLGFLNAQAVLAQLLDDTPNFDIREMPIVGTPAADGIVCMFSRASGFTWEAWRGGAVPRLGMTNRGSTTAAYATLMTSALGLPARPVFGYAGTSEIRAALAAREVDGVCMSQRSVVASFHPFDDYLPILSLGGGTDAGLMAARPAMPMASSARARHLLGLAQRISDIARFVALPPRTPDETVQNFRTAFARALTDERFLAAARTARLAVDPKPAQEVESGIRQVLDLAGDARRDLIEVLLGGAS